MEKEKEQTGINFGEIALVFHSVFIERNGRKKDEYPDLKETKQAPLQSADLGFATAMNIPR